MTANEIMQRASTIAAALDVANVDARSLQEAVKLLAGDVADLAAIVDRITPKAH